MPAAEQVRAGRGAGHRSSERSTASDMERVPRYARLRYSAMRRPADGSTPVLASCTGQWK